MGRPWRAHPAWRIVDLAEVVLDEPVGDLLLTAPAEVLCRTREAQLAIMLASLVAWEAVRDELPAPVAYAGHSLGQVTALVAAGILDLDEGLRLAARRAECTQEAADASGGAMAALIGAGVEQAEAACEGVECWVANDNAPGQVVIGGTAGGVEAASARSRELGAKRAIPLTVGGAFHTPLMEPARTALVPHLDALDLHHGSAPVVSNLDARPHRGTGDWKLHLADHLVRRVRWRESMESLAELGADSFVEVGPGAVLGGLAQRTVPMVQVRNVGLPEDVIALRRAAEMEVA